jgi:hypothetical protein
MMTGLFSILIAYPLSSFDSKIFFPGEALADILDAASRLASAGISTPADTLQRLHLLAALPRFKMLLMFLEAPSIACLHACIDSAASIAELANNQSNLRRLWGID